MMREGASVLPPVYMAQVSVAGGGGDNGGGGGFKSHLTGSSVRSTEV